MRYGWTGSEDKEDAAANEVADVVDVVVLDKAVSPVLDKARHRDHENVLAWLRGNSTNQS